MRKTWLIAPTFIALAITACSTAQVMQPVAASAPILTSVPAQVDGSTVEVRIDTGTKMQTKAAKKTAADIHHYHIKLVNTATDVVVAEGDTTEIINFFHKVPNGTYRVLVDAFDANGVSVVQGGAQPSSNTVIVTSPSVSYSDGANCLKVRLKLLDATGEKVGSKIIVEDGNDWSGSPELQPGGDCPCPTPTPVPTPTAVPSGTPTPYPGHSQLSGGSTVYDGWVAGYNGDIFANATNIWQPGSWPATATHSFNGAFSVSRFEIDRIESLATNVPPSGDVVVRLKKLDGTYVIIGQTRPPVTAAAGTSPFVIQVSPPIAATELQITINEQYMAVNYVEMQGARVFGASISQ